MASLGRILLGLLMLLIGVVYDVFVLTLFGTLFFFMGMFYQQKNTKKAFVPEREELPIDEDILAEMKRDMGEDFVPPKPKKKKEETEEKDDNEKNEDTEEKNNEETNKD